VTTAADERTWSLVVPHHPRGARVARHRLAAALAGSVSTERLSDAAAIAAELVGNAVRHAAPLPGGCVRVAWRLLKSGRLIISVCDGGSTGMPTVRSAGPEAVDGRGLAIVSALARRWGVDRDKLSQCVWAEL
jgi:anti-sigma regulatory factor (Ser/Thr protein kinase)